VRLLVGHAYNIEGMRSEMWDVVHKHYGTPERLAGIYLGAIWGTRRWHLFELRFEGRDAGVIVMNDNDLAQLIVTPL
jgi:hypothetical protein